MHIKTYAVHQNLFRQWYTRPRKTVGVWSLGGLAGPPRNSRNNIAESCSKMYIFYYKKLVDLKQEIQYFRLNLCIINKFWFKGHIQFSAFFSLFLDGTDMLTKLYEKVIKTVYY